MFARFFLYCLLMICGAGAAFSGEPAAGQRPRHSVFFDARQHKTHYAGPGREDLPPEQVGAVLLGYFGPSDPSHPEGGDLWSAAQLALDEANAAGGYRGKPFRLVAVWSDNPWGTGVAEVVRMVYRERVWAIIGGIDGPSTHLAEQAVAKARLTLLNPASTDKTVNLANVPWMFSLLPGDHLAAPVLAAAISERVGERPFVLISADDHDSHCFAKELKQDLHQCHIAPRYHFQCHRGEPHIEQLVKRVVDSQAAAAVLMAGPHDSARLVKGLREAGFSGTVFGSPGMGRRGFVQKAGRAAEGVLFPLLGDPQKGFAAFAREFRTRSGHSPDYAAAHTYSAVRLLVAAIRKAGLNRAAIRDAVEQLSPWPGVAGAVTWDPLGANSRKPTLGTIRNGDAVPVRPAPPAPRFSVLPEDIPGWLVPPQRKVNSADPRSFPLPTPFPVRR